MTTTNLNKLAAICRAESIVTKAAQHALLRQHGHEHTVIAELEKLITKQDVARRAKNARLFRGAALPSYRIEIGGVQHDARLRIGRPEYYRMPLGTPAERRELRAKNEIRENLRTSSLRLAKHGEIYIKAGETPNVAQTEYIDFNIYRSTHKGRPCRVQDTTITVPLNWYKTVCERRLGCVDGLVTISAEQIAPTIYRASWLENARGTSLRLVHGWIAIEQAANGRLLAYHSTDSAKHAETGLAKKIEKWLFDSVSANINSPSFKAALKNHKTIVTVRHAQRFGLCLPGIRSWLANTDLDPNGKAPLSAVAEWVLKVPNYDAARFVTAMQINSAK